MLGRHHGVYISRYSLLAAHLAVWLGMYLYCVVRQIGGLMLVLTFVHKRCIPM